MRVDTEGQRVAKMGVSLCVVNRTMSSWLDWLLGPDTDASDEQMQEQEQVTEVDDLDSYATPVSRTGGGRSRARTHTHTKTRAHRLAARGQGRRTTRVRKNTHL